jgi:hypothetical protein
VAQLSLRGWGTKYACLVRGTDTACWRPVLPCSFCMYDAKQMRVLAARDGSGSVDLYQARSPKDSLVISSEKQVGVRQL